MATYRPRVKAVLSVPTYGLTIEKIQQEGEPDLIDIDLLVRSCEFTFNDHNHADEAQLTCEWQDVGVDPRYLQNARVQIWMKNTASDPPIWQPEDIRFIGFATKIRRKGGDNGMQVEMEFQDYTSIFIKSKPFPGAGIPNYQDTLRTAWQKVCDNTGAYRVDDQTGEVEIFSLVSHLKDRLEARGGVNLDQPLGKSIPVRLAALSAVQAKPDADGWAVWQQCVNSLGLISFIEEDKCVVTTSTERFSAKVAPRLIWGRNILSCDEEVDSDFFHKGIILASYDSLTGQVIEAIWPAPTDPRIQKKRVAAAGRARKYPGGIDTSRYDKFEYHDVTDQATLLEIAKRAYAERSRQELRGTVRTAEMFVEQADPDGERFGSTFDMLELRAGDPVRIEINEGEKDALIALGDTQKQVAYLLDRGYQESTARLIVRNMATIEKLIPTFHVKSIKIKLESSQDGGSFEVDCEYHNMIKISGDTDDRPVE